MPIDIDLLPTDPPDDPGDGGELIAMVTPQNLDIYADLQGLYGPQAGSYLHDRLYPKRNWDGVSAAIETRLAQNDKGVFRVGRYLTAAAGSDWTDGFASALADAEDYAASNDGALLVLPPGTGYIGASQDATADRLGIVSEGKTRLRMENGADLNYILRMGYPNTSTSAASYQLIAGITFDGNHTNQAGGSGGLLEVINSAWCQVLFVECAEAFDAGFIMDTYDDTVGSSVSNLAHVMGLLVRNCEGEWAAKLLGQKNVNIEQGRVCNNGRGGALIQGREFTANKETTQCQLTGFRIHDNGLSTPADGIGLVMDNTTRWVVSNGHLNFNPAGAIQWRRTLGVTSADGANQGTYSHLVMRNNGENAACTAICGTQNSGDLQVAELTNCIIQGNYSVADQIGIHIEGGDEIQLIGNSVRLVSGAGIYLENTNASVISCELNANGADAPSVLTPHGLHIEGGRGVVMGLRGRNTKTNSTHGGYEIYIDGTPTCWHIVAPDLDANEDGYELGLGSSARPTVKVLGGVLRSDVAHIPTVVLPATANQALTLPDDVLLTGVVRLDGTAGACSIDTLAPLAEGTQILVIFTNGANVTLNHNAGGSGDLHMAGGGNVVGSGTKGVPFTFSNGSWWTVL